MTLHELAAPADAVVAPVAAWPLEGKAAIASITSNNDTTTRRILSTCMGMVGLAWPGRENCRSERFRLWIAGCADCVSVA